MPRYGHKRRRLTPVAPLTPATAPTPTDEEITEKDLPLLANVDEVKVHHYLIKLSTDFNRKIAKGTLIIFLEWLKHPENVGDAKIILDACTLKVQEAYSLKNAQDYDAPTRLSQYNCSSGNRKHFHKSDKDVDWFGLENSEKLSISMSKWSITISGWSQAPSVVRIDYETLENSPSLHWRPSNGHTYGGSSGSSNSINKCAYTPAPPVNNRGLFPCQEPPSALATWEMLLEVENYFTPLVTSDEPGEVISIGKACSAHYFYTSIPLPMSTFAMVIGQFCLQTTLSPQGTAGANDDDNCDQKVIVGDGDVCQNHIKHPCRFNDPAKRTEKIVPVRLFSLDSDCISSIELERFSKFVFCSLKSCHENFGPHPFGRLDLIIMPKCFPHMGFSSPSMIFLSPCNFSGGNDPLFVTRIPHEICHSWFGLLIGALDWTEEWLSEGFATFCEDIVFNETYQSYHPDKSEEEVKNELALKICLRFIDLQNELRNTDKELHVLSTDSNSGNQATTTSNRNATVGGTAKNGLVPIKQFMHVHYYKGYFLLWHLTFLTEEKAFQEFLKEYIWKYHGQLVTSNMFLNCFHDKFKDSLCAQDKASFMKVMRQVWLESDTLPSPFAFNAIEMITSNIEPIELLPLFQNAVNSVKKVQIICRNLKAEKVDLEELQRLTSCELLLLYGLILGSIDKKGILRVYKLLQRSSFLTDVEKQTPELVHRWCELIVLCQDENGLPIVEQFLENNLAMGVYLYGELMITEEHKFQKLAKDLFHKLEGLYDMGSRRILKEMLF